jgi:glutamine synthetase adenylyltransferase
MSDKIDNELKPTDLDYQQAQLAYSIIENLIEHTRVVSDLIAMMAQVLDEDTTKALTQTPAWTAYLDSRRAMEKTHADVERFAEVLKQLKPEEEGSQISDPISQMDPKI